ncbi:MAG: hypothetical protein AB1847_11325 [bacterium]
MEFLKTLFIGIFLAAALCSFTCIAWAIPSASLSYIETSLGGGTWQYDYTLFNASDPIADAGYDLYDLSLNFNPSYTYTVVQLPTGWDEVDGAGFITAFSQNPGTPPVGTDIAPGEFLSGFTFQFDYQVGNLPFDVTIFNPSGPDPIVYSGTSASGTAPVPEPSPLLLFSFGFLGLLSISGMKKRIWKG